MAATFDALLRIKADVQGEGAINKLSAGLGNLQGRAAKVSSGFRGLASSAGGLVGGLQTLVPLATGAGLVGLATNSIKAAEGMYDLSQRTGLSVEALSRFRRPAAMAGTDIETVAKSLQKLSKSLVSGKGGAVDGLKELGIKTTDAAGKMKSADQILLEVADRFKAMPDGIQKTGLAMEIFGRAGAEMIPMLNMGGAELAKFKGITTDYAKQADAAGDSMIILQGKVGALGGQIARVLLPFIIEATKGLTAMVDGFSKLPGPIQVVIGGIALLAIAWGPLVGVLTTTIQLFTVISGLQLGAVVTGWAAAIVPAVGAMTAALGGFLAFLTGTVLPALIGFFSGPVGWTVLAIAAVVAMAIAFREPIMGFLSWLGGALLQGFQAAWEMAKGPVMAYWNWYKATTEAAAQAAYAVLYQVFVQPYVNLWENVLRAPVTAMGEWLSGQWQAFGAAFSTYVAQPIANAWTAVVTAIPKAMQAAADAVRGIWASVVAGIQGLFNGAINFVLGGVRGAAARVNRLIGGFNSLPGPDISLIPAFARGGYVTRPTIAQVGEGGEPEYIVPESKVSRFVGNIAAGKRGAAALAGGGRYDVLKERLAMAAKSRSRISVEGERVEKNQIARSLGFIPGAGSMPFTLRPGLSPDDRRASGSGSVKVSVTTGPVLEFNGQQYVTRDDFERGMRATADGVVAKLRTPGARIATGRYR